MALAGVHAKQLAGAGNLKTLGGAAMGLQFQFRFRSIAWHSVNPRFFPFNGLVCPQVFVSASAGTIVLFCGEETDPCGLIRPICLYGLIGPTWCCYCAGAFFRSQQRHQDITFHARHGFDGARIADFAQQASHLGAADFLVRHFASAMKNHGANLVAFAKEADYLVLANLKIVFRSGWPELYFFQRRATAAFTLLVCLLTLLIEKLAVVGDLANWRVGGGRNLHQVQSTFASHLKRFKWLHYPELAAFFVNHPDFASANPIVDTDSVAHLPEIPFCDKSPSS